jgi:transposase
MVRRVIEEGWRYQAVADAFAVSVRTVAKWVRRYREGGLAALEDASSRPGPPPQQTPPPVIAQIRLLRTQHGLPAWAIGKALSVPRSTVSAWLRRLGISRPPVAPPIPVQRYEWPQPGDLLHLDIKPLGRIGCVGHRIHGDRRRDARDRLGPSTWPSTITAASPTSGLGGQLRHQLQRSSAAVAWFAARGI